MGSGDSCPASSVSGARPGRGCRRSRLLRRGAVLAPMVLRTDPRDFKPALVVEGESQHDPSAVGWDRAPVLIRFDLVRREPPTLALGTALSTKLDKELSSPRRGGVFFDNLALDDRARNLG